MVLAFFSTWMIQLLIGITVRNPLTVVLFVLQYLLKRKTDEYTCRVDKRIIIALSALVSLVMTALFKNRATERFDSSLFKLIAVAIVFVGFMSFIYMLVKSIGVFLFNSNVEKKAGKAEIDISKNSFVNKYYSLIKSPNRVFILSFVVIIMGWLPYFLYEYPGIMTADSLVQYEQIAGIRPYSNHHPMIHTLIIQFFYSIGRVFSDDKSAAISFYTVFQMLFFGVCLSFIVRTIRELLGEKSFLLEILSICFFAFVPFNAVFAVTIWKDIPFAGITALLTCHIIKMEDGKRVIKVCDWVIFICLCILFALFRSNAWYSFIVWVPFCLYIFRENIKSITISCMVVLVVVVLIKGPIFNVFGVEKPDFVESLSVPTAQIARVLVNDRVLTAKQKELIDNVIDTTYIHELYAPDYADNIKELVRAGNVEYLENNKGEYFKLWVQLGVKYFPDYVMAWYDLLGGYVYPDFSYTVGDIDGIMGNDYGLVWKPVIGGKVVVKVKEILIKLGGFVPIYGMFWSIGTYFWFLVYAIIMFTRKKVKAAEAWLLLLMMFTLLIAAPNLEFRYAYSLTIIWTLLFARIKHQKLLDSSQTV